MSALSLSAGPALPVSKVEKLRYLLEHWEDLFGPPVSLGDGRGSEASTPHLSSMSRHPSVVELVRCLGLLKASAPRQHDHVMAYYTAEWRVATQLVRRARPGKRKLFESVEVRRRERIVPRWVRLEKVRRGEAALVGSFVGEVFIPQELWDALMLSSEAIAEKERRRRSRAAA